MRPCLGSLSASSFLWLLAASTAQTVPPGFAVDTLTNLGTLRPNDCCFLPDGRCVVVSHAGAITLVAGTAVATVGTLPNVQFGGELGLLSVAADPGFATNGYLYVYYSDTLDAFMHVDRFTCTGDLANPTSTNLALDLASRRVVLGAIPDTAANHNGGSLRFGPDGRLYLSIGDDSWNCVAQSLMSQSGCVVRLDVSGLRAGGSTTAPSYTALDPGDNPLSAATDFSQLVIAHGLRNPFRMEIDPLTGNLYIGDVGHLLLEEYSEYRYVPRGVRGGSARLPLVNFGWPMREGNIPGIMTCAGGTPADLVEPIAVMTRTGPQASIIGGARYRSLGGVFDFGPMYEGEAFYLDYYTGLLRRARVTGGTWQLPPPVPGQPTPQDWGTGFASTTCLRLGPDGALWFTQHFPGRLRRIRPAQPHDDIVAVAGDGQRGPAGETFAAPIVVRVVDPTGAPRSGAPVCFLVDGPGTVATPGPVLTDAAGLASTTVAATAAGGAVTVTATAAGALAHTSFDLYARRISAAAAGPYLVVSVVNDTDAVPPLVPYVVLMAFPGSPSLPTVLGTLCIDPSYALAIVLEDGTGVFGGVSQSGSGGVGTPHLVRSYVVSPSLLAGQTMRFQAVGLDSVSGWFRTDCATVAF